MKSIWTGAIGFGLVNIPVYPEVAEAMAKMDLEVVMDEEGKPVMDVSS